MVYIIFFIVLISLLIGVYHYPGYVLSYILFFQSLNNILFSEIGFAEGRYIITIVLLLLLLVFHYSDNAFNVDFHNFITSNITLGYVIIILYMILYTLLFGGEYEMNYLLEFIFPGSILFLIGAFFFFKYEMYKQLFYGIIVFGIITFITLIIQRDLLVSITFGRDAIDDIVGVGPILQARFAGLVILSILLIFFHKAHNVFKTNDKHVYSYIWIPLSLTLSIVWLALLGTRGVFVAIIFTLIFYMILYGNKKYLIQRLFLSAIMISPLLFSIDMSDIALYDRLIHLQNLENLQSMRRYERILLFKEHYPNYFIQGLGPGGWGAHIVPSLHRDIPDYPHNLFMEILIEYGILGMLSLFLIIPSCMRTIIRLIKKSYIHQYLLFVGLIWLYYFFNTMFSGSLFNTNTAFFTLTGIMIGISKYTQNNISYELAKNIK